MGLPTWLPTFRIRQQSLEPSLFPGRSQASKGIANVFLTIDCIPLPCTQAQPQDLSPGPESLTDRAFLNT